MSTIATGIIVMQSQKFLSNCSEGLTPSMYSNLCSENHRKAKTHPMTARIKPNKNIANLLEFDIAGLVLRVGMVCNQIFQMQQHF